jgi:antitoxin VapB
MSLNIKNPKTYQLAREVAELAGESMAQAVTTALEERKAKLEKQSRMDSAWALSGQIAKRLNDGLGPRMEIENLYDEETGLPK